MMQDIVLDFIKGCFDSFHGLLVINSLDKKINAKRKKRVAPSGTKAVRQKNLDSKEYASSGQVKEPEEWKVFSRIVQCAVLNGCIFIMSIVLFEYVILPILNASLVLIFGRDSFMGNLVWSWIKPILSTLFNTVWVIPLFLLCKVVNALWFQDIANCAFEQHKGKAPVSSQSISKMLADSIFSIVIQILFLILATAVNYIPIPFVAYGTSRFLLCLLYSLYAFEYKWINMGWDLPNRLSFIETNWPYFFGFGLSMVLATELITESCIISGCIFSILFPFHIISANEANRPPGECGYSSVQVFAPVIYVANFLFSIIIGSPKKRTVPAPSAQLSK